MLKRLALLALCLTLLFPALPVRADTGPTQRLGTGIPTSIAASPDGKTLAVGSSIGVWLLDAATLTPNGFWDTGVWVNSAEYSTDGRYLKVNEAVYDTVSGTPAEVDAGQVGWVNHRCSFDGHLCSEADFQSFAIITTATRRAIHIFTDWGTKDATWSPDGKVLYGVVGGFIRSWNTKSWLMDQSLDHFFTGELSQVLWSPNGTEIASDKSVWDVNSAQITRVRKCRGYEYQRTFDCSWPVMLWSYQVGINEPGRLSRRFAPHHVVLTFADLSRDKSFIATSGGDTLSCDNVKTAYYTYYDCSVTSASVRIWDAQSFALLAELPTLFYNLSFSLDGRLIIGHTQAGIEVWDWRGAQRLWSADENVGDQCPLNYYGGYYWCRGNSGGLSVNSSSEYIATYAISTGNTVRLYRLATGERVTTLTGHTAPITGVAFSPDGTKVAASSLDGTILIWNVP